MARTTAGRPAVTTRSFGDFTRDLLPAILSILDCRVRRVRHLGSVRTVARSKVPGLLQREEVLRRQLLPLLESFEDEFRLFLRVDFFGDFLGHTAALHPDPMDDLVVVVDLADVLDVLAMLLVREHLRLD